MEFNEYLGKAFEKREAVIDSLDNVVEGIKNIYNGKSISLSKTPTGYEARVFGVGRKDDCCSRKDAINYFKKMFGEQ